jgi:hypothetical protein
MACNIFFDVLSVDELKTKPPSRRSKKRDEELKLIKKHGQVRRVLVSTYSGVLNSDIPLYEALVMDGYAMIEVVLLVGHAERADIKAAKALSAKHPLTPICPEYPKAFRRYMEYVNGMRYT